MSADQRLLKNLPFTWFGKLTTGFDKPVLSEVEELKANGGCIENIENFPFVLSLVEARKLFFNSLTKAVIVTSMAVTTGPLQIWEKGGIKSLNYWNFPCHCLLLNRIFSLISWKKTGQSWWHNTC